MNGTKICYDAIGDRSFGEEQVLIKSATDLSLGTTWHERGFTIEKLFDDTKNFDKFLLHTQQLLAKRWAVSGLSILNGFKPDQYHTLVDNFEVHLSAIDETKLLHITDFPIPVGEIEKRVSEICNVSLVARNPYDGQSVFHFRVIRPNHQDNNPLHRDVWLPEYDHCINLYIPIAGSDEQSSLILLPGSHLWEESRIEKTTTGALINGIGFNVPAVTRIEGPYEVVRPNPSYNQLLVFSPYLIHGGSVNLNTDRTRISIEMRLWKQ